MRRGGYPSKPWSEETSKFPKLPKGPAEGWPKPSDGGAAMTWKEISQQQNLELSKELLERQGRINELTAEVRTLHERRDKAIKRLAKYRADTFLSEQIIAILTGPEAEADWYAKYDIKPSGEL